MYDQPLSVQETTDALNAIRSVDLKDVSKEGLAKLILNLSKHLAVVTSLDKGSVIIRSVSCNYLKDNPVSIHPLNVSQISYNPNASICGYNRASWEKETAFYGSVATDVLQPYYTSSFEVLTDLSESPKNIDRETFVVGKWVVTKQLPLVHLSGDLKHNDVVASSRYNFFYQSISKNPEHMITLKMIDSYLCNEFAKEVSSQEKWKYKVSAAYADFVRKDGWPGILYPSLKTDGAGYNVALFPNTLHQYLKFESAALMTYYKRDKNIVNEITMEAFPDGDRLKWKEVYKYLLRPDIKKWHLGLSNDKTFEKYIDYEDL